MWSVKRHSNQNRSRPGRPQKRIFLAFGRALAFFIGGFSLLNLIADLRYRGFGANHWWIDFRPIPSPVARTFLTVCAVFLILYAIRPALSKWRRPCTLTLVGVLLAVAIWNAANFYYLLAIHKITAGFPIAFSLFSAAALSIVLAAIARPGKNDYAKRSFASLTVMTATIMACMGGFPVAQMYCFGRTDYSRTADVIVVFGARVYANGRVSDALADRIRTGCRLYLDGLAGRLILSGGPGDGHVHETEAMKKMAVELGVPADAILLDADGINTRATVENTCRLFDRFAIKRVLAVSHFYHLPRIKMTYQRRQWEVYTVPAKESYTLTAMPKFILREIAALWLYYLRPLVP